MDVLHGSGRDAGVVLGYLGELGEDGRALHAELGKEIEAMQIARLLPAGPDAEDTARLFGAGARHFASGIAFIECLLEESQRRDVVLIKGSRAQQMDRIVEALVDDFRK